MSAASYKKRQEEELEVLQSIYVNDVHDLRSKKAKWKAWQPMELKIRLKPQKSMNHNECYTELTLRVTCGPRYPDTPPTFEVLQNKGVPNSATDQLMVELSEMADKLKGEVMILNLCQHAQEYLVRYNTPTATSVYDEMIQYKLKQKEQQEEKQKALEAKEEEEEEKMRVRLAHEVRLKQEQIKEEARRRRANSVGLTDMRLSYSSDKSPDDSEASGALCKGHKVVQVKVTINGKERTLHRARCLGHSSRGSIAFMAMESTTGDTFCLHEWIFTYKSDRPKDFILNPYQQSLLSQVDSQFGTLCRVQHPNLIRYLGIIQEPQKDKVAISILQEMLTGHVSLKMHISRGIPLDLQVLRSYCQDILSGLLHLHDNDLVHRGLALSNIFVSQQGVVRISDFGVVKNLDDLMKSLSCEDDWEFSKLPKVVDAKKTDVYTIGLLTLSLAKGTKTREEAVKIPSSFPEDFQDFLRKCLTKSEYERWGVSQLINHKFITQKVNYKVQISNCPTSTSNLESLGTDNADENAIVSDTNTIPTSYNTLPNTSRLKTEFQILEFLGSGGFGLVLKVRNKLDSRIYAIKQIPLDSSNKHLNRKINREVMLLSRLNHENVVRYFNSWIEVVDLKTESASEPELSPKKSNLFSSVLNQAEANFEAPPMKDASVEWSVSLSHVIPNNMAESSESSEDELFGIGHKSESSDIMFEHSTGDQASSKSEESIQAKGANPALQAQYMFIQMEFCEKKTLRSAIDDGLYKDVDRMWRLFREIIEGLGHIHQQGIIHRDLKPVNIFLDSDDRAKIGDFGLATTARAAKPEEGDVVKSPDFGSENRTGKVGTELYTAPESETEGVYTQKVDIYSLGVIFFEMCYPCHTKMERARNLANIRLQIIKLPQDVDDHLSQQQMHLVQWLLQHDPSKRPTSIDLLSSDYLPPPIIEEAELNEMLRHTVSNPQSKTYKKLLGSLFNQPISPVGEFTFDMDDIQNSDSSIRSSTFFAFVRERIETIMKLHGAQNVNVPLLMPRSTLFEADENVVELMDNQGSVVSIPHNTRVPFARYVARKNIPFIKRYAIEKVFRSRRILGCHPKELFEASFDIASSNIGPNERLPLMEVLSVTEEVIFQFAFSEKSDFKPYLRINHFGLLKALLLYTGITDEEKQLKIMKLLRNRYMSRLKVQNQLSDMNLSETCINMISQFREVEDSMPKIVSMYRSVVHNKGAAGAAAKDALEDLDAVVTLLENIQCKLPIVVVPCLVHDVSIYNTGVLFEVKLRADKNSKSGQDILAVGGCYDNLVNRFRVRLKRQEVLLQHRAVGVSFTVDRLAKLAAEFDKVPYVDSVVCTTAQKAMNRESVIVLRALWLGAVGSTTMNPTLSVEEVSQICREINVNHLLLLKDTDPEMVKVRTFDKDKYSERRVSFQDAVESVAAGRQDMPLSGKELMTPCKKEDRPATLESLIKVTVISQEKLSALQRKRIETQVVVVIKGPLFKCINDKLFVEVIAVDMNLAQIRNFAISLNVETDEKAFQISVKELLDRTDSSSLKSYYETICDRVRQLIFDTSVCAAFVIFGRKDNSYKIIVCPANCRL
ncbi:eukaryotic translation initiation factor 2-alpha kinase 4-like [Tropilaelaps mercedesae]|uniref:non-specific serine/threonine protein kinase n=1 Tax=Tropilaelaps mercedesae TaxID=418985 RepID=A0A1V9WY04_9ACAR|nr:eukaryotic translation initiation factor 2-alpha kinase 4-like [Tropilaelaps mercedesae]